MEIDVNELKQFGRDLGRSITKANTGLRVVVRKNTAAAERTAKRLVPVGEGDLRDSIHSVIEGHQGTVIAGTDHAEYVEDGTSTMAPQPFMTPALQQQTSPFLAAGNEILRKLL